MPSDRQALWDFILCIRPEFKASPTDSLKEEETKIEQVKSLLSILRGYAKTCFQELKFEVLKNPDLVDCTWGMLSTDLRLKYIVLLEKLARKSKIELDTCQNRWGAERLLANAAHNSLGKKVTANIVA